VKKAILKYSDTPADEEIAIYAIASSEPELKLCMLLNDQLGIQLAMAEDAVVEQKKEVLHFRQYADLSHEEIEKLTLVVNRSGNHYFIPELKQVDYLLIIRTEGSLFAMKEAIQNLKGHKGIAMLTELDPDSIKSLRKWLA